jgi:phosphatidylglycerol lysyltransferase
VFFEVRGEHAALYRALGLRLTMLGEEARIDLAAFSIDDSRRKSLRHAHHKALRAGLRFEIVPREAVPPLLPELARVSTDWLSGKATQEKGFSNASFDAAYLRQFPIAVVRHEGRVVAFANVWQSAELEELSIDLMRYSPGAPYGTMDYLFVELLRWGQGRGFRWFNFGMAPLAGLERRRDAAFWSPVAAFVFRHGEHFYNFEGLRRYKAKFDPVWTPLFLASPGGAALPRVLLDVTALIAGGTLGIFAKHANRSRQEGAR